VSNRSIHPVFLQLPSLRLLKVMLHYKVDIYTTKVAASTFACFRLVTASEVLQIPRVGSTTVRLLQTFLQPYGIMLKEDATQKKQLRLQCQREKVAQEKYNRLHPGAGYARVKKSRLRKLGQAA
jgi:hypothetical protein